MPHASVKLIPGVNQNETPVLNETGVSSSQLIRYIYDPQLGGLIQKLGGWTKYYPNTMSAIVRALWAWEDDNSNSYLAVGTENVSTTATLSVITNGVQQSITPQITADSVSAVVSSTSGSSYLLITDTTTENLTNYDSVYIATQISVGGVVLFGLYPIDPNGYISATQYTVQALNLLGVPQPASFTSATSSFTGSISGTTLTVSSVTGTVQVGQTIKGTGVTAGTFIVSGSGTSWVVNNSQTVSSEAMTGSPSSVPALLTTNASPNVTVILQNHGYTAGSTFPILVSTTIGGVQFYGNYIVQSVTDANTFVITSGTLPTSTTSDYINGGNAYYIYCFGVGAIPAGTGYGIGGYGTGGYGTGTAVTPATGTNIAAIDWTMDNWGNVLIACPNTPTVSGLPQFDPIYQWDATGGSPTATVIQQAPPVNTGVLVAMPQRQIIAYGSTFTGIADPLLVRWCDVNNYGVWVAQVTNQAGSYRIPKGSRIVGAIQAAQQTLLWTDIGLWSMQYISQPYVYGFNEVGTGCGLIAKKAAASINGVVYWMGPSQFFTLAGGGVQTVPCPVWDVIFQDIDQNNTDKIRVAVNSRFNEISWFYPTSTSITGSISGTTLTVSSIPQNGKIVAGQTLSGAGVSAGTKIVSGGGSTWTVSISQTVASESMTVSGEVTSYVKLNVGLNAWDFGVLGRTAWVDQSVLGPPIGADPNTKYLYQHETSTDADGQAMLSSFQTGYYAMSEADVKMFVDEVWPDMKYGYYGGSQSATISMTFYTTDFPGQTPQVFGPFTFNQATTFFSPRFRGRLTSIAVSSSDVGSFWRIGGIRYRYQQDGKY